MHDYKLTHIRTVALFSIIAFHCLCFYSARVAWPFHGADSRVDSMAGSILVSFALPFYVMISGSLAGLSKEDSTLGQELLRKTKRLIVPYVSWTIIQIPLFYPHMTLETIFSGMFHLWFLLMLFWCYVFFYITRKQIYSLIANRKLLTYSITFMSYIICRVLARHITDILCLRSFVLYLPFFLTGILARRDGMLSNAAQKHRLPMFVISGICFVVACVGKDYLKTGGTMAAISMDLSLVSAFLSCYALFPGKKSDRACWIEKHSLGVYIIHHIIIWIILTSFCAEGLQDKPLLGPFVLFVICTPAAFALTWIISRIRILNYCLL